jgi:hypothetical protein
MLRWSCLLTLSALALHAGVVVQHDYDAVSDAVVSWRLEPGASLGQSIALPQHNPGARLGGFRMKLQRLGDAADLEFRLGSAKGKADIASGRIRASTVSPWFEHWYGARFPKAFGVEASRLFLELRLPAGSRGRYDVYGTATQPVERPEFQSRFQYVANVDPQIVKSDVFENPVNIDYGAHTPVYDGGSAYDSAGELAGFDLAFQLYSDTAPADCEERFSFIEEITGPLYSHSLRDPGARPSDGEVTLDTSWTVASPKGLTEPAATAAREFREFLDKAMGVRVAERARRTVQLSTGCPGVPVRSESFRLSVSTDRINVCGSDASGVMRGLHHLEALMRLRRAPIVKIGEETRQTVQSPRITSAPFYSHTELDTPVDPYTPGLLGRMSRAGFNAIWVWGDIEDVAHSSVYPELDHGVAERQQRLRDLISRASRYGIDVYVQLGNRPQTPEFFTRHPDVQGSAMRWYGGSNVLCTSVPQVREHLRSATRNLMTSVPGLKGFVYIVGGEGFLHCWTRANTCPRCSKRSAQDVVAEFSRSLFDGARQGNPQAAVAFWPYSASNTWSRGDTTQSKLIAKMPAGITLMTEFAKEGAISFGGTTIPAYDYPISIVGPSERFVNQAALAAEHRLGFWAKTEHAIALEFVDVPYIPVFFQWAERFKRLRESQATAQFDNWMHYGFTPSLAADVFYWNVWSDAPAADSVLHSLARRDFGRDAENNAVKAWQSFSAAVREYPFSGSVAMGPIQKGPSHPLFFDPTYQPVHVRGRQFKNDLNWTRPWGPELTIAQLTKMQRLWSEGVNSMTRAVEHSDAPLRRNAERELGVAKALESAITSTLHVVQFYSARDRFHSEASVEHRRRALDEMAAIARAEVDNAGGAVPSVCADSRLGYANSGKNDQEGVPRAGIYSATAIRKKIAQVERVLQTDIPAARKRLTASAASN